MAYLPRNGCAIASPSVSLFPFLRGRKRYPRDNARLLERVHIAGVDAEQTSENGIVGVGEARRRLLDRHRRGRERKGDAGVRRWPYSGRLDVLEAAPRDDVRIVQQFEHIDNGGGGHARLAQQRFGFARGMATCPGGNDRLERRAVLVPRLPCSEARIVAELGPRDDRA